MSFSQHVTQTVQALTTRIFKCRGLAPQPLQHDQFGVHDVVFWLVFASLGAAWYFFLLEPQRQRNAMLQGRLTVLNAQQRAEDVELRRLRRELDLLRKGDTQAWERAARKRLGWLLPGEETNIQAWRRKRIEAGQGDPLARKRKFVAAQFAPHQPPWREAARPRAALRPRMDSPPRPVAVSLSRQVP